jgi:hypothetical protein
VLAPCHVGIPLLYNYYNPTDEITDTNIPQTVVEANQIASKILISLIKRKRFLQIGIFL